MLVSLEDVRKVPELKRYPVDYLNFVIRTADAAVKRWLKRNPELTSYTEYYSGTGTQDLRLKQYPVTSITGVWVDAGGYHGQKVGGFGAGTQLTQGDNFILLASSGILRRVGGST